MFSGNYQNVFDASVSKTNKSADVYLGTIDIADWTDDYVPAADIEKLKSHEEAFLVTASQGKLTILGVISVVLHMEYLRCRE